MASSSPNFCIENPRRSSISSACPSSSASSFSTVDTPDSFTTPSPSWPTTNTYGFSTTFNNNMKDMQEGGLIDLDFPDETIPPMDFMAPPYSFRNVSFTGYDHDPFYSGGIVDPLNTMHTSTLPNTSMRYDCTSDRATAGDYFEPEVFTLSPKSDDEIDVKGQNSRDQYGSPMRKEKGKRPKCKTEWAVTVPPGKFKCSFPNCTTVKSFVRAEHLKRHEKTVHDKSGKQDVFCRWCRRKFSRADNCHDHEIRHSKLPQSGKSSKRVEYFENAKAILDREKVDRRRKPAGISKPKATRASDKLALI